MRLIAELTSRADAQTFSTFLKKERVENLLEEQEGHYWIWVEDEERVEEVQGWLAEYRNDPTADKFRGHDRAAQAFDKAKVEKTREATEADIKIAQRAGLSRRPRLGWITLLFILACGAIYLGGSLQREGKDAQLIFTSSLYGTLLYDFPHAFELLDTLHRDYTVEQIKEGDLPPAGEKLLDEAMATPFWQGLYVTVLKALGAKDYVEIEQGPLYEKLREGQVWRLVSPILLHADLFHLLFNMIWLIVLGNQIEYRLGPIRYLLLILFAALISNAAQYLASGPAFLGISGVVLAMLGFIWMRQRQAPWEGYRLTRATVIFISIYVVGLFTIQLVSFGMEIVGKDGLFAGIANTAHLSGAITGAVLGRLKFFAISSNL